MTAIATADDKTESRSFLEVWVITIGHALTHWYPATFYLLLPLIGAELGLSYSQIGMIMMFQYLAGAMSNIPGGIIVDAIGRKGLLMALSLFWIGFPYLIMGFSNAYWTMIACTTLIGIGNNLWHPTAIPLLARRFPDRKGLVVALHGMGGNVGDAVAPLAAGALLLVFTWREVVIMNVLPGIAMAGLILLYLGRLNIDPPKEKQTDVREALKKTLRSFGSLVKNKTLLMLSIGSSFRSMTQGSLLAFLPLYLAQQLGYSPFWVGACMFALQAAGFAAAPAAGHLSDKIGRRSIMMSTLAISAVILFAMAFAGQSLAFVVLIAFLGFFLFAVRAVLQAWVLDAAPKNMGGSAIGFLFATQAIGGAFGPPISGILADQYGIGSVFYFLAATIIIANLFVFFTPADEKPQAVAA
jgi:FSR family fosmidomycin resistance protein-like MFS transporter